MFGSCTVPVVGPPAATVSTGFYGGFVHLCPRAVSLSFSFSLSLLLTHRHEGWGEERVSVGDKQHVDQGPTFTHTAAD